MPKEAKEKIQKTLEQARQETEKLIQDFHNKKIEAFPGKTLEETLELKILEVLNKARNESGKIVAEQGKLTNNIYVMAISGARGNSLNLAQMAAVVGQQSMRGKRIETGYKGRTLSNYKKGQLSADARGFIKNSFKSGLKPAEYFFNSITGRDSLMDTALRTPKSGYLYRRLANAMQDLKIEYDHTVREASGKIVQFKYGEDGIDVSKSENGKVSVRKILEEVTGKSIEGGA